MRENMQPSEISEDIVQLFSKNTQSDQQTRQALQAIPRDMTITQFLAQSNAATIDTSLSINSPLTFKVGGKTIEGLEPAVRTVALLQEQARSHPDADAFDTLISCAQQAHQLEQIIQVKTNFGEGKKNTNGESELLEQMVVLVAGLNKSEAGGTLFHRVQEKVEGIRNLSLVEVEKFIRKASPEDIALQDSIIIATAQNLVQRFSELASKGPAHFNERNLGTAVNSCLSETKKALGTATPFIKAAMSVGVSNPDLLAKLVTKAQSLTNPTPKELRREMRAEMKSIFQEAGIEVQPVKLGIMERLAQMLPLLPRSPQTSEKLMLVKLQQEMKKDSTVSFAHSTTGDHPAGRTVSLDSGTGSRGEKNRSQSQDSRGQLPPQQNVSRSMAAGFHGDLKAKGAMPSATAKSSSPG